MNSPMEQGDTIFQYLETQYSFPTQADCEDAGIHLVDCDEDGYCNCCGFRDFTCVTEGI